VHSNTQVICTHNVHHSSTSTLLIGCTHSKLNSSIRSSSEDILEVNSYQFRGKNYEIMPKLSTNDPFILQSVTFLYFHVFSEIKRGEMYTDRVGTEELSY